MTERSHPIGSEQRWPYRYAETLKLDSNHLQELSDDELRQLKSQLGFASDAYDQSARTARANAYKLLSHSSRRAAGRPSAAACAKRGCIGQMQTPAELVPIPDASRILPDASRILPDTPDTSGCVGILNSGKVRRVLAKFRQNFGQHL